MGDIEYFLVLEKGSMYLVLFLVFLDGFRTNHFEYWGCFSALRAKFKQSFSLLDFNDINLNFLRLFHNGPQV